MIIPSLTFSDFTTLEKYNSIKRQFVEQDSNINHIEEIKQWVNSFVSDEPIKENLLENPVITIKYFDAFTDSEINSVKKFIEDFILPIIGQMADNRISQFKYELNRKGIYDEKAIGSYATYLLQMVKQDAHYIEKSDYLNHKIRFELLAQVDKLDKYLENYLQNPYPDLKKKLQFNWNRTDVIYFFHLLRKNKVIAHIPDADLGRFIDNICEYLIEGDFAEIKDSRKHLSDYNSGSRRPETPAIDRIKNIFSSDAFFD